MSQSDYVELFLGMQEAGATALTIYLTVISGYLVVAYLAGSDLSRFQNIFVSVVFVVFSGFATWGVVAYFLVGEQVRKVLEAGGLDPSIALNPVGTHPALIAGPMLVAGIFGALRFMWDVRRKGR